MEDASRGLAHDLAMLDRAYPDWDYEIRITGAIRRLSLDASDANQRDVKLLFGEEMATEALRRIRASQ